jgi:hypothetical protein
MKNESAGKNNRVDMDKTKNPVDIPIKPVRDLVQHSLELQAKAKARSAQIQQEIDAGKDRPVQMRLFPDDVRVIPNYLARTPLFAPVRPGRRKQLNSELLASPRGFELRYSGEQLDQSDCDVFMQLIQEARGKTLGEPVSLNRADFLFQIGRDNGGKNYAWLSSVFKRLNGARIHVESERYKVNITLVSKTIEDKVTGAFQAVLDPDIIKIFSANEYTHVDWDKRKAIERRVDLCKWMQNFICSNEKGLQRHGIENLRNWSGYNSPIRKFREALLEAMQELERVGIIISASFYEEDTKVKWTRL